jgi:MFS family permease
MFFLSAGLMLCVLLFTYKLEAPLQTPTIFSLKETIILCLKNPKFLTLYSLACIPSAYWIYLYLFYPLYATTLGYSATAIGITLGLAMLPLILFEPFIGSNYHKYSAKKLCTIGCAIVFSVFLLALVCPASYLPTLLIIAAIGIAFLEPTIETYFFQRISNEELYTVFRTNSLIGRILCLGVLSTALLFGSYMNVVACVGFIFVIGIIIARRL